MKACPNTPHRVLPRLVRLCSAWLVLAVGSILLGWAGVARAQPLLSAGEFAPVVAAGAAAEPLPTPSLDNPLSIIGAAGGALGMANGGEAPGKDGAPPVQGLSTGINILLVLTIITLAPSIMLMTTCFVRITVVLGLLKQAIGTQTLPPPQVILGLALFMTLLVMSPTLERINREAIAPYNAGTLRDYDQLWMKARQPMRDFMFDQIERTGNWSSVYMLLNYRGVDTSDPSKLKYGDVDMVSLIPAFMLSELKTAFLIGFKVYLPFLVIDMVISALLISMGMMMLPPVLISLPFKLLLFVLVDGWQLVVGSLLQSFTVRPGGVGGAVSVLPSGMGGQVLGWVPALGFG